MRQRQRKRQRQRDKQKQRNSLTQAQTADRLTELNSRKIQVYRHECLSDNTSLMQIPERKTGRQTDRQTDIQTDRQVDKQTRTG